ncbi:MAG: molybdopterin cofactor-binding domain-containing protein [Acidimicrobiales bacterium]
MRLVAVDDAGTILNPLLADGQVHGGLAQGAAQALIEGVVYDPDGNPLTGNFADFAVISATELPFFERITMETPTPATGSAPRASASRARWGPRRRCRTRWSTPWRTSGCATWTCRSPPRRCGGRSGPLRSAVTSASMSSSR